MCLLSGIHRRYRMVSPRAWRSLISVWPCASENSVSTLREADVLANPYRCTTPGCRWPWYRTGRYNFYIWICSLLQVGGLPPRCVSRRCI